MTVIEIGDLRTANGVKCGIVIEARKEELQEIAGKILYREVTVEPIKESPEEIWNKKMEEMCEKLIEIDQRLREQKNTKKYTRDEVLAMLDEIDPSEKPIRRMVIEEVHISELAEWIEAAAKREGGNAAALREAIEPWVAFGEWLLENAGKEGLGAAIREYGPIIRQRLEELRAALSAPARNCDKYDNFNDALRQFVKERPETKKIDEQGRSVATAETYCVFANWLLAPAAERKGECDE